MRLDYRGSILATAIAALAVALAFVAHHRRRRRRHAWPLAGALGGAGRGGRLLGTRRPPSSPGPGDRRRRPPLRARRPVAAGPRLRRRRPGRRGPRPRRRGPGAGPAGRRRCRAIGRGWRPSSAAWSKACWWWTAPASCSVVNDAARRMLPRREQRRRTAVRRGHPPSGHRRAVRQGARPAARPAAFELAVTRDERPRPGRTGGAGRRHRPGRRPGAARHHRSASAPIRSGATSSPTSRTSCARRSPPSRATPRRCSTTPTTPTPGSASCDIIQRHAARMERLVKDLLRLARLDAGQELLERAPTDVRALLDGVVDDLEPLDRREAAAGVGRRRPRRRRRWSLDAAKLHDIVRNLVENAVNYTPAGGAVRCRRRPRPAARLSVVVADNGPGIPAGRPGTRVRALLPRRQVARPARRHRAGAGDRQAPGRPARRRR